jgi:formate dehydrogenase maturation protein FdhE
VPARSKPQEFSTDDLANLAAQASIATFLNNTKLQEVVSGFEPAQQKAVEAKVRSLADASIRFVESYGHSILKSEAETVSFTEALNSHLRPQFPWASEASLERVRSHALYYAWHEGF